jgi:hypothetical protein
MDSVKIYNNILQKLCEARNGAKPSAIKIALGNDGIEYSEDVIWEVFRVLVNRGFAKHYGSKHVAINGAGIEFNKNGGFVTEKEKADLEREKLSQEIGINNWNFRTRRVPIIISVGSLLVAAVALILQLADFQGNGDKIRLLEQRLKTTEQLLEAHTDSKALHQNEKDLPDTSNKTSSDPAPR